MNRSGLITITILTIVLVGAAFYAASRVSLDNKNNSEAARTLGTRNDDQIRFTDLDGNPVALADYDGTVRVVNSWASWCPFCVNELSDFAELAREFSDEGVVVLAINRKESVVTARAFIDSVGGLADIVFVQDPDDVFYKRIGGFSMPETVFYDEDGNITFHKRGFMSLDEMREHMQDALAATNTDE